jgi:hypothetical protein
VRFGGWERGGGWEAGLQNEPKTFSSVINAGITVAESYSGERAEERWLEGFDEAGGWASRAVHRADDSGFQECQQ